MYGGLGSVEGVRLDWMFSIATMRMNYARESTRNHQDGGEKRAFCEVETARTQLRTAHT